MGEIDTKSIESVQAALSLFEEKNDQRKYRSTGSESEKEKEYDLMLKDLANYKVQLEVKESAYMQALLKLEFYQKTVNELSAQLKNSEVEKYKCNEEGRQARTRIDNLASEIKEISNQLLETVKAREQLLHVVNELKAAQEELLNVKAELAAAEESKHALMTQAELMESAANLEKKKTDKLLKHISELNEAILMSNLASIEAEKNKSMILSEKEVETQMATTAAVQAQEQLEEMRKQIEVVQDLENQLLAKSLLIDSLQLELKQAKELHNSSSKAASDAINDLNQLKSELEQMEREKSNEAIYVKSIETELQQLQLEVKGAKEEAGHLAREADLLTSEIQKARSEMNEIRRTESEAQVEIAMLKSELHKGRSKIAAAEAAEARAKSVKSGAYLAVQQLAVEAEEAKKEARRLKAEAVAEETGKSDPVNFQFVGSSRDLELLQIEESKKEAEDGRDDPDVQIIISMKEYNSLIMEVKKADFGPMPPPEHASHSIESELDTLQKELEAAISENWELRSVAEQAETRAGLAEKAKVAIEDQLRKWREQKQKRRAAIAALREESAPRESNSFKYDKPATTYQPLGKVLKMKF